MGQDNDTQSSKVIHIFQRHRRGDQLHFPVEEGGELIVSPDGFNYVTFREERNDTDYAEIAGKKHYLFRFVEEHKDFVRVDSYYVSGDQLGEFTQSIPRRPGRLIEIRQFIPDHMA